MDMFHTRFKREGVLSPKVSCMRLPARQPLGSASAYRTSPWFREPQLPAPTALTLISFAPRLAWITEPAS